MRQRESETERETERAGERGKIDIEMLGLPLFYFFTVQLHLLCVGEKIKVPFITF